MPAGADPALAAMVHAADEVAADWRERVQEVERSRRRLDEAMTAAAGGRERLVALLAVIARFAPDHERCAGEPMRRRSMRARPTAVASAAEPSRRPSRWEAAEVAGGECAGAGRPGPPRARSPRLVRSPPAGRPPGPA